MHDKELIAILEEVLGVDATDTGPFSPKVISHTGPNQKACITYSRDLSLRKNSAILTRLKLSGTLSRIISGIDVGLMLILTRLEGSFASTAHPGEIHNNFHLSDFVIVFYGCSMETQKRVAEELGIRKVGTLLITSYLHTNSLFGETPSGQETKPLSRGIEDKIKKAGDGKPKTTTDKERRRGTGRFKAKHKIRV
jgi:hypothetical protein